MPPRRTSPRIIAKKGAQLPDIVLTLPQWAEAIGIGYSSAKELMKKGQGPVVTRLSTRRVGVRVSDHHRWLDARRDIR
jgi:predicted DNA-binding transcriptional regulator AlpA